MAMVLKNPSIEEFIILLSVMYIITKNVLGFAIEAGPVSGPAEGPHQATPETLGDGWRHERLRRVVPGPL